MPIARTTRRITALAAGVAAAAALAAPAGAQPPPQASCLAQFVSGAAQAGGFGQVVSVEARHPELLGVSRLGEFIRGFARAQTPCPTVP